jgi:hypothetical protein
MEAPRLRSVHGAAMTRALTMSRRWPTIKGRLSHLSPCKPAVNLAHRGLLFSRSS